MSRIAQRAFGYRVPVTPRIIAFVIIGLGLWGAVVLEKPLERIRVALPVVYVAIGWAAFALPFGLPTLEPAVDSEHATVAEYLTEFIVIVSLMTAGLAIDRPLTFRGWKQVAPLIVVTLPISIVVVTFAGWAWLGLAPAAAILLGASLSPTDPVLAESVQVEPPNEGGRNDVRFDLTVEAGVNDGLAFPFTYLAIAAVGQTGLGEWTLRWFALDVVWRIVAGIAVGVAVARVARWYVFDRMAKDTEGEGEGIERHAGVVVTATLIVAYGVAETVEGYGFLAVFVGAVLVRQSEPDHNFHERTHHFVDQIEQVVLVALLFGFGGLLASGVLAALTWPAAILAFAVVILVRPLAGLLSLVRSDLPPVGRLAVAFLGIRGMGTLYYLSYGQNHAEFGDMELLWATAAAVILVSIVVHGLTAARLLDYARDRSQHRSVGTEASDHLDPAPG